MPPGAAGDGVARPFPGVDASHQAGDLAVAQPQEGLNRLVRASPTPNLLDDDGQPLWVEPRVVLLTRRIGLRPEDVGAHMDRSRDPALLGHLLDRTDVDDGRVLCQQVCLELGWAELANLGSGPAGCTLGDLGHGVCLLDVGSTRRRKDPCHAGNTAGRPPGCGVTTVTRHPVVC